MADLDIVLRSVRSASTLSTTTVTSDAATAVGDYLLVVADVDYRPIGEPGIQAATGVEPWVELTSASDLISTGNYMTVRAWLGRVTAAGSRSVTLTQSGASALHAQCFTLDASGGTVTLDAATPTVDRSSPFTHASLNLVGTKDFLLCAHGQVQFSGTTAYGAAPSGMTAAAHYQNANTGMQSCWQTLSASGATGTRSQTSSPTSVTGGAGLMLALRSQGDQAGATDPVLVATYPVLGGAVATSGTVQTLTTPAFTPAAGEVIVVKAAAAHSDITVGAATGGGLTYASRGSVTLTSYCPNQLSTAVVGSSPSSMTVSVPFTCNTLANRYPVLVVERWTGTLGSTPAVSTPTSGTTTEANSANVSTTGADPSAITWLDADWEPVTTGTVAYRSGAVQNYQLRNSAVNYWSARQTVSAAGTQVIGTTSPTGQRWTMLGVEIKGTAAASSVTKTGSDSGTGSETGSVSTTATGNDSGSGTETGYISVPRSGSDSGTGSETGRVDIGHVGSDSGTGTEGAGQVSADTVGGDTALGADSGTVAADTSGSDSGTGAAGYGHIVLPGGDTAAGTDELGRLDADTTGGDTGAGAEGGYVETRYGDLVISLYGVDPDSGALVPLPDFETLTMSPQRNAAGSITVDYPVDGINFDWLYGRTVGRDADLEVEIWNYGNVTGALRGYLQEASGFDVGDGRVMWTFAGRFLELRMSEARVEPQPLVGEETLGELVTVPYGSVTEEQWERLKSLGYTGTAGDDAEQLTGVPQKVLDAVKANAVSIPVLADPKRELKFAAASPGAIVSALLTQARARGTLTDVTTDADDTVDSDGNPWPELITTVYSPSTRYDQILDKLTTDGRIEWALVWTGSEKVLRVWVAGKRGVDRTEGLRPVVLRAGRNIVSSPRKWSVKDAVTRMFAAGSEGWYATASDLDARTRRGRTVEGSTSSNTLGTADAVTAYAQHQLSVAVDGTLEVDHSLGFLPGEPRPLIAFDIGDWVYSQTGTAMDRYRVVQWSLTVDAERNQSGIVVLNDAHTDALVRQRQQLDALTSGDTVVGTSTNPRDTGVPLAPEGLVVGSAAFSDGPDVYAVVTAGWAEVTTNTDGTRATDVDGYRVEWTRFSNPDAWVEAGSTPSTQLQFSTAVGMPILVRVLCYDRSGNRSEWTTLAAPHTTDDDVTPPGVPSTPSGANYLGTVAWTWDGLTVDGAEMYAAHPDFAHAQLHMSTTSNFAPDETTRIDTVFGAGTYTYAKTADGSDLVYGTSYFAKLVAVDLRGNASEPSGQASAVTGKLVNIDLGPDAVERANIRAAAIGNAQIDDLAVNDAKIMDLNVGKLVAGTLQASMILGTGAIISGNPAGYHTRFDSSGIRLFGADGVTVATQLLTSNGSAMVTGEYRSAQSGRRFVINPGGGMPDEIRFYRSGGPSNYGRIRSIDTGQGTGLNIRAGQTTGGLAAESLVTPIQASMLFGDIENGIHRSRMIVDQQHSYVSSPVVDISADTRYPADGNATGHRISLFHLGGNGLLIQNSLVEFVPGPTEYEPWMKASFRDCGIVFGNESNSTRGMLCVVNNAGNFQQISAAQFNTISGRAAKEDVRDARAVLDPLNTIRRARARAYRLRSQKWVQPGTPAGEPEPAPVPVDAPVHIGVIAEDLPDVLVKRTASGIGDTDKMIDLGSQIGVLWGALGQISDQQIRTVIGRVALTGQMAAGDRRDLPVTWDEAPLEVPTGGVVTVHAGVAWMGKITAVIVPGSLTMTGCTVRARALAAVVPTGGQPVTLEPQGLYLWTPPYGQEDP